jgi:hypothetical protein
VDALRLMLVQLRQYTQVADPSVAVRRLMPALMRGADGRPLALTRRQRNTVEKAIQDFAQQPQPQPQPGGAEQDMVNLIVSLQGNAFRHQRFDVGDNRRLSDLFQDPPALLTYLQTATVQGSIVPELRGQPLVVPGNPDRSAFVRLLQTPDHPMRAPFHDVDPNTGKVRIEVVRAWIQSLPAR